jgi:hypothetical protein
MGYPTLFTTPGVKAFAEAVDAERQKQLAKWGDQHHPDGTAQTEDDARAASARHLCQSMARMGRVTWRDILWAKVNEALAESEPDRLETKLVECATVIQAWTADLHSRRVPAVEAHRCDNCEGVDPGTCLMNPERRA